MGRTTRRKSQTQEPLREKVARLEKPLVAFLRDFCAIDTTNPPGRNYKACCQFLKDKLASLGLRTRLYRVPRAEQTTLAPAMDDWPRYNLVARWDVGATCTLHFTGHYDVVPATAGWTRDPFDPLVKGGRLIARGASDMKGSNACAIFAVQAMKEAGLTPPWNIEISFTADEETGGRAGLGWLVHTGRISPDAAVLCEGGGRQAVGIAHRGVLWAEVAVHGKAGHAGNPGSGVNAFDRARLVLANLAELDRQYRKRRSAFVTENPACRRPTIMAGGVAATGPGDKINTIPDRFTFSIDRRILPEEKLADVKRELRQAIRQPLQSDRKARADIAFLLHVEPGMVRADELICQVARQAIRRVYRANPRLRMSSGFNDMHYLTNDGRVPTVGYGARGKHAHGDNEYVSVPELLRTTRVYADIALNMPADA